MSDNSPTDPSSIDDNARAEYSALSGAYMGLITTRFTITGLYVAGMAFIAGAIFQSTSWGLRAAGSGLALWLTVCLWIQEVRTRSLQTSMALRGIEIEHEAWNLIGERWNSGFFSRQYRVRHPNTGEFFGFRDDVPPPVPPPPSKYPPDHGTEPTLAWSRWPLPRWISRVITYDAGFDLLYLGGGLFWLMFLGVALVRVLRN